MGELKAITQKVIDEKYGSMGDLIPTNVMPRKKVEGIKLVQEGQAFFILPLDDSHYEEIIRLWSCIKNSLLYSMYNKYHLYKDEASFSLSVGDDTEETIKSKILTAIRKIRKREGNKKYTFRIEKSKNGVLMYHEMEVIPMDDENEKPKHYMVIGKFVYDGVAYQVIPMYVNFNSNEVSPLENTTYMVCDRKAAKVLASSKSMQAIASGYFDKDTLMMFAAALSRDAYDYHEEMEMPHYSKFELEQLLKLYLDAKSPTSIHTTGMEINSGYNSANISDEDIEDIVVSTSTDVMMPAANRSNWPIIRFTDREWKSVFRYIDTTYKTPGKNYSLREKLSDPKFGTDYRFPVEGKEINISYKFKDDTIVFTFVEVMNDCVSLYGSVTLK